MSAPKNPFRQSIGEILEKGSAAPSPTALPSTPPLPKDEPKENPYRQTIAEIQTKPDDPGFGDLSSVDQDKSKEKELFELSDGADFERHPTSHFINRARATEAGRKAHLKRQREQYSWTESPVRRLKEEFSQRVFYGDEVEGPDMPLDIGIADVADALGPEATAAASVGAVAGPKGVAVGAVGGLTYAALRDWWNESQRSSEIYKKAHETGFSSLSDEDRKWLKENSPKEVTRKLRAETTGPYDLTPEEINRISLEQEWYERQEKEAVDDGNSAPFYLSRDILLPPKVPYDPSAERKERERRATASPITFRAGPVDYATDKLDGTWDYRMWEEEWKKRAAKIPDEAWEKKVSRQERQQILGIDQEFEERREQEKKAVAQVNQFKLSFDKWLNERNRQAVKDAAFGRDLVTGRARGFPVAVRDLNILEYVDANLYVDLQKVEQAHRHHFRAQVLADPQFTDASENEVEMEVNRRYDIFENYITKAGSGVTFYHPDIDRAVEKQNRLVEEFKSGKVLGFDIGQENMDKLALSSIRANPVLSLYDLAIPAYSAFGAPRYSVHLSDTHADFTSHRAMDLLIGMDPSNWLAAALKTKEELVFGYTDTEGERVPGRGGIDAPQAGEDVSEDKEKRVSMRYLTENDILEATGSQTLAEVSKSAGGEKGAGFGLLTMLTSPGSVFPEVGAEQVESAVKTFRLLGQSVADINEIKRGLGDDEITERYLHNLRRGQLLPLTYDSLASRYAKSMGATKDEEKALRRAAILVGISSLVTPGTGSDFISPVVTSMAGGYRSTRRFIASRKQEPKMLDKLAESDAIPESKIQDIKRKDRVLGESIEKEVLVTMGTNRAVGTVVNGAERAAEKTAREAWILGEAAGMHASPAVLPGGRLTNRVYRDRWLDMESASIQREAKIRGIEVDPLETSELALKRLEQLEAENIARIERNTAIGDVYRLDDQMYIKTRYGWMEVNSADEIVALRSNTILSDAYHPETFHIAEPIYSTRVRMKGGKPVEEEYLEGVKYRERSLRQQPRDSSGALDAEVKFDELPGRAELRSDTYIDDVLDVALDEGKILPNSALRGATAVNVRNPITIPTEIIEDGTSIVTGSTVVGPAGKAAEKKVEALRAELAAAELRALEARREFELLKAGEMDEFKDLQALHSLHAQRKQEVEELIQKVNDADISGTEAFKSWSQLKSKTEAAEATLRRAEQRFDQPLLKDRLPGSDLPPVSLKEAKNKRKRLRKLRNKARERFNRLAAELEEAGKPIAAKQKEYQKLHTEMSKAVAEMRVLRSSLDDAYRTWDDPFLEMLETNKISRGVREARGVRGVSREGETKLLQEEADFLENRALKLEKAATSARKKLKSEINNQAKDLRGPGAARVSAAREALAIKRATAKEFQASVAGQRANVLNGVLRKRAQQIREGNRSISSMAHLEEAVDDALEVATKQIDKQVGGKRIIDASMFMSILNNEVGREVVEKALEGGGQVAKVLNQLNEAALKGIDAALDGNQTRALYEMAKLLRKTWRDTHEHAHSIGVVEALETARKDPDMSFGSTLATFSKKIGPSFDPVRSRTGLMSDDLIDVAKYAEHATGHVRDELEALARHIEKEAKKQGWSEARKAQKLIDSYTEYFTTTTGMPVMRARTTFFNEGSENLFTQSKWQMLNDPRGMGLRQLGKRADDYRQKWLDEQVASGKALTKELEKQADKAVSDFMELNFKSDLEGYGTVAGLPLRAVSRSFIPEWGFGGANLTQAARAYNQAYDILEDSLSFSEFIKRIEDMNFKVFGGKPLQVKSTQHLAYAMSHAAIQHRANLMMARMTGYVDPKGVKDTANFFAGNLHKVEDFDAMLATMNKMGLPFTQNYIQRATGMGILSVQGQKATKELVATGLDKEGRTFFMPQTLAQTIDDAMPSVTKDLEKTLRRSDTPLELLRTLPDFDYNRLWKTSVVTGLFVPRPKYFWNNFIGDWGQIWFEQGFGTAAGISAQLVGRETYNMLGNVVPGAKYLRRFQAEMTKKYGAENTLGSTWNAFMNPHANKIWRGEEGVLRTRYGAEYKYSEVRKMLQEEGVLDTMVHEELLSTFDRYVPDSWTKTPWLGKAASALDDQRYNISWLAMHVQQRQRGNLFMEMLRRGYKPQDAGRLVKNALYDWKHAMTRWETLTIGKLSPFYRFWRLGFGQTARRFMEPITLPPQEAFRRSMMGESAPSRLRQKYAALESIPHLTDPELAHEHMTEQEVYDHAAKYYRPSWAQNKFLSYISPADTATIDHYWRTRGQEVTHTFGIMPPDTTIDTLEIGSSLMMGLAGAGLSMLNEMGISPNLAAGPELQSKYFTRTTLDLLTPTVSAPFEAFLTQRGVETGSYKRGDQIRLNGYQRAFMDKSAQPYMIAAMGATGAMMTGSLGGKNASLKKAGVGGLIGAGLGAYITGKGTTVNDREIYVGDRNRVAALELMPLFGGELANFFNLYAENPYAQKLSRLEYESAEEKQKLIFQAAKFGFGTFMGQSRYSFSPETTIMWRNQAKVRAGEAALQELQEEQKVDKPIKKRTID